MPGPVQHRTLNNGDINGSSKAASIWSNYKNQVADISDAYVNQDGEAIWNTFPQDLKLAGELYILPYACRTGELLATDKLGNVTRLSHSRGSNATFVDKDGYIKYAPHNLLTYSVWSGASSGTPGTAPTGWSFQFSAGTLTLVNSIYNSISQALKFDTSTARHVLGQPFTTTANVSYVFSIYIESFTGNIPLSQVFGETNGLTGTSKKYYDANGIALGNNGDGSSNIAAAGRYYMVYSNTVGGSITLRIGSGVSSSVSGTILVTLSSPQIEIAAFVRKGYIPTASSAVYLPRWTYDPYTADYLGWLIEGAAATNLLTNSVNLLSGWGASNCSVSRYSSVIGMDGTPCSALLEDGNNVTHQLTQGNATISASSTYTASVYVKQLDRQYVALQFNSVSTAWNGDSKMVVFDLINGTVFSTVGTGCSGTITRCKDGWFRCTLTATTPSNSTGTSGLNLNLCKSDGSYNSYQGVTTSGVLVCCAQMEAGSVASSYIPTYASSVTRNADNVSIPSTLNNFTKQGSLYFDGKAARTGSNLHIVYSSGGHPLYSNVDTNLLIYDNTGSTYSASASVSDVKQLFKVVTSWLYDTNGNIKISVNGGAITSSNSSGNLYVFDDGSGNGVAFNLSSSSTLLHARAVVFATYQVPDQSMIDWSSATGFGYETNHKKFKALVAAIGGYNIPEADSQYQRLNSLIRDNSSVLLQSLAFKGNIIFGMDNNGELISFTHSRGTLATQVNRLGLIEYCYHNLLTYSVWSGASSGTPGTAPTGWSFGFSGGSLALGILINGSQYLIFSATNARQFLNQSFTSIANISYTLSIDIIAISGTIFLSYLFGEGSGLTGTTKKYYDANWNLLGSGGDGSNTATVGRFYCVYFNTVGGTVNFRAGVGISGNTSGTVSATLANPQLYTGNSISAYCPTTSAAVYAPRFYYNSLSKLFEGYLLESQSQNLFTYSEQFDNGVWGNIGGSTIAANTTDVIAPSGNNSAEKITAGTSVLIYQGQFAAGTYTQSFYVKAGTGAKVGMYFGSGVSAVFDLSAGTVSSQSGLLSASISPISGGWFRCVASATIGSSQYCGINYVPVSVGDIIYLWGAQLESGNVASSYIPTFGSQVTRNADTLTLALSYIAHDRNCSLYNCWSVLRAIAGNVTRHVNVNGNSHPVKWEANNLRPLITNANAGGSVTAANADTEGAFSKYFSCWDRNNSIMCIESNGGAVASGSFTSPMGIGGVGIEWCKDNVAIMKILYSAWTNDMLWEDTLKQLMTT